MFLEVLGETRTLTFAVSSTKDKVMMSLDYGPDEFNSGVILYKPSATLFRDFREFLNKVILPLPKRHRGKVARSTQRLFQEFLFSPSSHYELYSFCGDTSPSKCNRRNQCYCHTHVYPQLHDCNKDKSFLQDLATIVHFAGGAIDYDALCDPNTSPSNLEQTIQNYFAKSRENHPSHADYDFECHRPIIQNIRDHYSSALHRIGI